MTENEKNELVLRTSQILGKKTRGMNLVDIIAELVDHVEQQEKMMKLFLLDK
jgi:hypothetical protein